MYDVGVLRILFLFPFVSNLDYNWFMGQNNDLGHLVVSQHIFMYTLEENVYPLLPNLCLKSLDL